MRDNLKIQNTNYSLMLNKYSFKVLEVQRVRENGILEEWVKYLILFSINLLEINTAYVL